MMSGALPDGAWYQDSSEEFRRLCGHEPKFLNSFRAKAQRRGVRVQRAQFEASVAQA